MWKSFLRFIFGGSTETKPEAIHETRLEPPVTSMTPAVPMPTAEDMVPYVDNLESPVTSVIPLEDIEPTVVPSGDIVLPDVPSYQAQSAKDLEHVEDLFRQASESVEKE